MSEPVIDLPDVNVWLALVDENHVHHSLAQGYWQDESGEIVAFCRVTALGFFRLSTHQKVLSSPLTTRAAWKIYREYLSNEAVEFIHEPQGLDSVFQLITCDPSFKHRLWTDDYLAALAISSGARIVSFDGDFSTFDGLNFLHLGS